MNKTGKGIFVKDDRRINRRGRPRSFAALAALAMALANADLPGGDGVTVVEAMLREWATSADPRLQIAFMEICYGRVPAAVQLQGARGKPLSVGIGITGDQFAKLALEARMLAGEITKAALEWSPNDPPPDDAL